MPAEKDRFLKELTQFLSIPSISAHKDRKKDMHAAASFVRQSLVAAGADHAEISATKGHPVVYAEKLVSKTAPTVLVYGHYDVQPVDPLNEWTTPPFSPTIRGGKIYARGATDDKGQLFMHIKALEMMTKHSAVPCNIKFVIEGEEEVGSPNLGEWCRKNKKKLTADVTLISDSSIISPTTPSLEVGIRGIVYFEVHVYGAKSDLHSGLYGGAVKNPMIALSQILGSLHDKDGKITVPKLYASVRNVSKTERVKMNTRPFNLTHYKKELGISDVVGEKGFTTIERTTIRPSLDVHGLWGGYSGEGAKTVLPKSAHAKVSIRTVPNQDSATISRLFKAHIQKIAPPGVRVEVRQLENVGKPYVLDVSHPGYQAAARAMKESFGKEPIPTRSGGSIPIVPLFKEILGIDSVLMGFGLETDNLHAPNEHFSLTNFFKGIETIPLFYKHFASIS